MPKILLGVSASVSIYKSADLIRRLLEKNIQVQVIPTQVSKHFIGTKLWETISHESVLESLWARGGDNSHVDISKTANLLVIAPCTANVLAKCANGLADDLLTNIFATFTGQVIFVPAMHSQMWLNEINQNNVLKLRQAGHVVIEPESGSLTSGDVGIGRYPALETILDEIELNLVSSELLSGKKILITAGGSRESIDPVRYIGNRSSGKQGRALAQVALAHGAQVIYISTNADYIYNSKLTHIKVESADEMFDEVKKYIDSADVFLMAAAVADKKPKQQSIEKMHKQDFNNIELTPTQDIAKYVGEHKKSSAKLLLFAAETDENALNSATSKLDRKKGDFIYLNDVSHSAIFGSNNSSGILISKDGNHLQIPEQSKLNIAKILLTHLLGINEEF